MQKVDIIIYHYPCADGIAAAWAIHRVHPNAQLFPINHPSIEIPADINGKYIVIVDFCYPRAVLKAMGEVAYVMVLDHHDSAMKDLMGEAIYGVTSIFDMKLSGCQIAWDFMNNGVARPWFIEDFADRDLWLKAIPGSDAVGKALLSLKELTFNGLTALYNGSRTRDELVTIGTAIITAEAKPIDMAVKNALKCELRVPNDRTYTVMLTAVDGDPTLRSEIGNILAENNDVDFSVTYRYDIKSDEWWLSLRRAKASTLNLADIAKKFPHPLNKKPGGGHPAACGFTIYGELGANLRSYFNAKN